jgi:RimJ/RimL family protein N-acetyltransferase
MDGTQPNDTMVPSGISPNRGPLVKANEIRVEDANPLVVRLFEARFAPVVASWVRDDAELFQLTPTTPPPLTPAKVLAWVRPNGRAYLGFAGRQQAPCLYGELNPMRTNDEHLWIGHVLADPQWRGRGLGQAFVRRLVESAFGEFFAERISLIVFPDNAPAIRCYERVGFTLSGDEHHRFGPQQRPYRMLRYEIDRPRPPAVAPPAAGADAQTRPRNAQSSPRTPDGQWELRPDSSGAGAHEPGS